MVAPGTVNRTVASKWPANADLRTREYLTEAEVEVARGHQWKPMGVTTATSHERTARCLAAKNRNSLKFRASPETYRRPHRGGKNRGEACLFLQVFATYMCLRPMLESQEEPE
jgi:hypothetical protein